MRTLTRAMLSCLALVVCVATSAQAQRNYGEALDTVVTLDRQATIDLSLMSGSVDIVGGSGTQARIRASSDRGDIQFDAGPGRLQLSVDPSHGGQGDARFELTVPTGTRVIVNSLSA